MKQSTTVHSPVWTDDDRALLDLAVDVVMEEHNISLTTEQFDVLERIIRLVTTRSKNRPHHLDKELFVTGGAGTGKSYLLRTIVAVAQFLNIETLVVAHQGVAALNINGSTLYSVFKPNMKRVPNTDKDVFGKVRLIIIDEISTVSAEILENTVTQRLQTWHNSRSTFGKATMVVFGDLMQLAPVGKESKHVFMSDIWQQKFELINLVNNHRQTDADFIASLNDLRWGVTDCITYFNKLVLTKEDACKWSEVTHLMATNRAVQHHNELRFKELLQKTGPTVDVFKTTVEEGVTVKANKEITYLSRQDAALRFTDGINLCVGCVVLFTMNSPPPALVYCNGDIGVVENIEKQSSNGQRGIHIRLKRNDNVIRVDRIGVNYDDGRRDRLGIVGTITGYPLTYGWAITIHKSQGLSLDRVVVDPRGIFAPAQLYVALSRARTPEGLRLLNRVEAKHVRVDLDAAMEYCRLKGIVNSSVVHEDVDDNNIPSKPLGDIEDDDELHVSKKLKVCDDNTDIFFV